MVKNLCEADNLPRRPLDRHAPGADFNGGLGPDHQKPPQFAWDLTHTQRVEVLKGGGAIIRINARCVVIIYLPTFFPMCGWGKIPSRGDLLDHMRDVLNVDTNPNRAP